MTVIELTRQLGAALQEDARYKEYEAARKANESDDALNELIGKIKHISKFHVTVAENAGVRRSA